MKKKTNTKVTRSPKADILFVKQLEDNWNITPVDRNRKTISLVDKYNPKAQVQRYNDYIQLKTKIIKEKAENTSNWINNQLSNLSHHESTAIHHNEQLNDHIENIETNNIDILQLIIIRENLLLELNKLIVNHTDLSYHMNEIYELIKAIRLQTLEIIENIHTYRENNFNKPFIYQNVNYLLKLCNDLNYLDQHDLITNTLGFHFANNPLAYKYGGNIINSSTNLNIENAINSNDQSDLDIYEKYVNYFDTIDNIDIIRLRNAEKKIQSEINSISKQNNLLNTIEIKSNTNSNGYKQASNDIEKSVSRNPSSSSNVLNVTMQSTSIGSSKNSRINQLRSENDDMQAIICHLEEKMNIAINKYNTLNNKKEILEIKREEAIKYNKASALAQSLAVEISIKASDMNDLSIEIKDIQRNIYFIKYEIKRKNMIIKQLDDDIKLNSIKSKYKLKIKKTINKEGLLGTLKYLADKASLISKLDSNSNVVSNNFDNNLDYSIDNETINNNSLSDPNITYIDDDNPNNISNKINEEKTIEQSTNNISADSDIRLPDINISDNELDIMKKYSNTYNDSNFDSANSYVDSPKSQRVNRVNFNMTVDSSIIIENSSNSYENYIDISKNNPYSEPLMSNTNSSTTELYTHSSYASFSGSESSYSSYSSSSYDDESSYTTSKSSYSNSDSASNNTSYITKSNYDTSTYYSNGDGSQTSSIYSTPRDTVIDKIDKIQENVIIESNDQSDTNNYNSPEPENIISFEHIKSKSYTSDTLDGELILDDATMAQPIGNSSYISPYSPEKSNFEYSPSPSPSPFRRYDSNPIAVGTGYHVVRSRKLSTE